MNNTFGFKLDSLRIARNLPMRQLADLAGISGPLVSNLISGKRVIGECTATKLANALQLQGDESESFIHLAINECSEKVLKSSQGFPSEILNLVAGKLNALGIAPDRIKQCVMKSDHANAALDLVDGKKAFINVEVSIR